VAGELLATGAVPGQADRFQARDAQHVDVILEYLDRVQRTRLRFDLVHDKSGSFWRHAARVHAPVLATLHLPLRFYGDAFQGLPPNLFFNCVSASQARDFAGVPRILAVVRNGIRVDAFPSAAAGREPYLLWMGRICEEKGAHVAIEVARRARIPLIIAGEVYPFSCHQAYFQREIQPHLQGLRPSVSYVGRPSFTEKAALLARAHALLLPSLVDETSSLVAMEAMACWTPVIGFRRGAIPEVVRDGMTGFVVDSLEEMTAAVAQVPAISRRQCRAHVEGNFTASRMATEYEQLYAEVLRLDSRTSQSLAA
jgi:glycosyltransferase involved in cell wall biosynthesis